MKDIYYFKMTEDKYKYLQIVNHIKNKIDSHQIADGEKLMPIRDYGKLLDVNNETIVRAYKKLVSDGFAFQKMGSGTYAKKKEVQISFNKEYSKTFKNLSIGNMKDAIDFAGETSFDVLFPIDEFKKIINKVLDRDGAKALTLQDPYGFYNLRDTINKTFWNNTINIDNILIISGAQQGIDIVSKAILNINDNVIVEKPTYGGALQVFKWRRSNIFEVGIENDGPNLKEFEKIVKKNKIRCFYTMSYFQNPTGISCSLQKKKAILNMAEKYDFYIIEDDYLSELIYDDMEYMSYKSLDRNNRVIYIKSFSKIFLPGVRIGYLICPDIFVEAMRKSKFNTDIATSSLMQRSLEMYLKDGLWKENISDISRIYKKRYILMTKYIDKYLSNKVSYCKPGGGLSFYLTIKDEYMTSTKLFSRLRRRNVYITPGVLFFQNIKDGLFTFRIGFSETSEEKIKNGLKIIREELNL